MLSTRGKKLHSIEPIAFAAPCDTHISRMPAVGTAEHQWITKKLFDANCRPKLVTIPTVFL